MIKNGEDPFTGRNGFVWRSRCIGSPRGRQPRLPRIRERPQYHPCLSSGVAPHHETRAPRDCASTPVRYGSLQRIPSPVGTCSQLFGRKEEKEERIPFLSCGLPWTDQGHLCSFDTEVSNRLSQKRTGTPGDHLPFLLRFWSRMSFGCRALVRMVSISRR